MTVKTSKLQLIIAGDNRGGVKAVEGTGRALKGLKGDLGGVAAGVGSAFSIATITTFGKKALDGWAAQAASVAQLKRLTGETAQDASLLAFAAQQTGVPIEKVASSAGILATNLRNGKVAAEGIATVDAAGNLLPFDQILANIADHVAELPPGLERAAAARAVFGRGGADLVKILQNGSEGIADMRSEMQDLGLEFDEAGLQKYQRYIGVQRDLKAALTGIEVEIGGRVAPAVSWLGEAFVSLPGPVREGAVAVGGLAAGVSALALGVGVLGPSLKAGLTTLHLWPAAAGASAAASDGLTASELAASQAALADAAAHAELVAALQLVGATEAEITAATAGMAGAETAAGAASVGLAASLGIAGAAAAAAYGVYKGLSHVLSGHRGSLELSLDDVHAVLGATNKEMLGLVGLIDRFGGVGDFVKIGQKDIRILYKMRDALADAGGQNDELDTAIRRVEGSNRRAAAAEKKYGDVTGETTGEIAKQAAATRKLTSVVDAQTSAISDAIDKVDAEQDAQRSARDAHEATQQAVADLAAAEATAAGRSQEYADAQQSIADAQKELNDDQASALDAQQQLNQARADAVRRLFDLERAITETGDAEVQARLKVKDAELEARRLEADPTATDLDREHAAANLTQAQHEAIAAEQDHTQAVQDGAAAQKAGIEGDEKVVDARKAVADANDKVREAVGKVAAAEVAARKVITDAQAQVVKSTEAVRDAKLAEARAWRDLRTAQDGAIAGGLLYLDLLGKIGPEQTRLFLAILGAAVSGSITGAATAGIAGLGSGQSLPGSPAGTTTVPPTRDPDAGPRNPGRGLRSRDAPAVHQTFILQGTATQTIRAYRETAREEALRMWRGTR